MTVFEKYTYTFLTLITYFSKYNSVFPNFPTNFENFSQTILNRVIPQVYSYMNCVHWFIMYSWAGTTHSGQTSMVKR